MKHQPYSKIVNKTHLYCFKTVLTNKKNEEKRRKKSYPPRKSLVFFK